MMYYQIVDYQELREEVRNAAEDWSDGRDTVEVEEVLQDLLSAKPDPQWAIVFNDAEELENRTDRFSKAIFTESEDEAQKALELYYGENYTVVSMQEMAEAIVKSFYDMKELP